MFVSAAAHFTSLYRRDQHEHSIVPHIPYKGAISGVSGMAPTETKQVNGKKPASTAINLIGIALFLGIERLLMCSIAGGGAGMMEALACHPLGQWSYLGKFH